MKSKRLRRKAILLAGLILLVFLVVSCVLSTSTTSMAQLRSQGKSVPALAFQPHSQRLALVAGDDYWANNQSIELWDLTNQKLEKRHPLEQGGVTSLAFSPDGLVLATASDHGDIHLYDSEHLALQATLSLTQSLQSLSFSPDGKLLATRGERTIWLWDVATQRLVQTLPFTPTSGYNNAQLSFSSDSKLLATQDDNAITLWQVNDGKAAFVIPFADPGLCGVTFVPQQTQVASCRLNSAIELIDGKSSQVLHHIENWPDATCSVAFAPDGQLFAALSIHVDVSGAGVEGVVTTLGLYRVADGQEVDKFDVVTGASYRQITISPNGEWLALSSAGERDVRLLSLRNYTQPTLSNSTEPAPSTK